MNHGFSASRALNEARSIQSVMVAKCDTVASHRGRAEPGEPSVGVFQVLSANLGTETEEDFKKRSDEMPRKQPSE